MRLFLRDGYATTTVPRIALESGVSRTSVFRYWGSKSDIVWSEFDHHTTRLASLLAASRAGSPTMTGVREAAVENMRLSMHDSAMWLERFTVIETAPELRTEEAARWAGWARIVANHVAARHRQEIDDVVPQSIGGAVQAAFLAVLRQWRTTEGRSINVLQRLDEALSPLCDAMQTWLPDTHDRHTS
nr:TetR family transcriptional regulator [Curtobacterium pusillum]